MEENELEIKDENVDFLITLYFKKLEIINNAHNTLTNKANFLFAFSTGFISIAAFLVGKHKNAPLFNAPLFYVWVFSLLLFYLIILLFAYKAYKPRMFYFDPDFPKFCNKYGNKDKFKIKKQLIANGVKAIRENEKVISSIEKFIKLGFFFLIVELIILIVPILILGGSMPDSNDKKQNKKEKVEVKSTEDENQNTIKPDEELTSLIAMSYKPDIDSKSVITGEVKKSVNGNEQNNHKNKEENKS